MTETRHSRKSLVVGGFTIAMAVGFNVPYAILAGSFEYPAILRKPGGEVLSAFNSGGAELVWTWYAFGVAAMALIPLAFALSISRDRLATAPALAVGAAISGALAGLAQAVGLFRWVFVVPGLAETYVDPNAPGSAKAAAVHTFEVLNAYGGVAIGEHLGQLLTAAFVAMVALMQWGESRRLSAGLGAFTAVAIAIGTGEGLALATGQPGDLFSLFTIGGFLGLTLWLLATGIGLMRGR